MANKKKRSAKPAAATQESKPKPPERHPSARFGRETADALVIAFAMAFLIRTFQAEQFVIPTGSMAPTLMGAHHDVECRECGQRYRINGSTIDSTTESATARLMSGRIDSVRAKQEVAGVECVGGVCPSCRYTMPIEDQGLEPFLPPGGKPSHDYLRYPGDRLVVNKYAYSFRDPERWDVVVFKYPGNATRNYIKRLVGLPGEQLRLLHGDLYTKQADSADPFEIAQKPGKTVMAMRQLVHDTDRDPADLYESGWPLRWSGDAWRTDVQADQGIAKQTYSVDAGGEQTEWLRYRHTPPPEPFWRAAKLSPGEELAVEPRPSLITDFTPYNAEIHRRDVLARQAYSLSPIVANGGLDRSQLGRIGIHWAGDLMVEADLATKSSDGELLLELVEAGTHYAASFDLSTGELTLSRRAFEASEREQLANAPTSVRGAGEWQLRFANFDNRLRVWVDGSEIAVDGSYDGGASFAELEQRLPRTSDDDEGDLAPASVGVRNANAVVDRLSVWRDIYYVADSHKTTLGGVLVTDYQTDRIEQRLAESGRRLPWQLAVLSVPSQPDDWDLLALRRSVDFSLTDDQLFVMGDNSGHSLDARLWAGEKAPDGGRPGGPYLERKQLIGKATWVYWPRAWYTVPTGIPNVRIPIVPNFADMRLVR